MNTSQQVRILSSITTRDEAGKHFSEIYSSSDLAGLEAEGLITIERPVHAPTGISYSQEYSAVHITPDGQALVDANPEDWDV